MIWFHHHTREELTKMAQSGIAVVVPLAATEQHGPHLPVFTDSLICEYIVGEAMQQAAKDVAIVAAPVLPIGCSHHHLSFGGTLSFSSATYLSILHDIGESLVTDGFTKIIFVNAHGGNDPMMIQTVNDLAVRHPIWTAAASYWRVAGPALQQIGASEIGMVPGHAGGFETAAILALRPELVHTAGMSDTHPKREWIGSGPAGTFIGRHGELTGCDGYTDSPLKATAELGQRYLDVIATELAGWLVKTVRAMDKGEETTWK